MLSHVLDTGDRVAETTDKVLHSQSLQFLEKVRHQENEDRDNCIIAAVSSARKERMRTQARILTSMAVKVIQLRWKEAQDESQDRMRKAAGASEPKA